MKIISWNVNGLRACVTKGFLDFVKENDPDIICLQETKMQQEQKEFDVEGYYEYWYSAQKKGYSGTAIFSKTKPISVANGFGIEEHDNEGRVITAQYDDFYLVNVYSPNSKSELARLDYRQKWQDAFVEYLSTLDKPVIICGDLNVAHNEIDLKNPKSNRKNAGFSDEERQKMTELLDSGFIDTYRYFYPTKQDAYTWWSYRFKAREKNIGWRIDYFLVSNDYIKNIEDSFILDSVLGSDHCPVAIKIRKD